MLSNKGSAALKERFRSCTLVPVTKDLVSTSPVSVTEKDGYIATAYYLDSSGRSSFVIPLQLGCETKEDIDLILSSGCLDPPPTIISDGGASTPVARRNPTSKLQFEVKSHSTDGKRAVTVEGINILSCSVVDGFSILFQMKVVVRAADASIGDPDSPGPSPNSRRSLLARDIVTEIELGFDGNDEPITKQSMLLTQIDIAAVLVTKSSYPKRSVAANVLALDLNSGSMSLPDRLQQSTSLHTTETRLKPVQLLVSLTHSLTVSVRNVSGPSNGSTIVSLTIQHSNTHDEPVTITNVALHPGHSRQNTAELAKDKSMAGGQLSVTDMSKYVKWYYAPQTEPKLPLTLKPHDAYATVIMIEAGEDLRSRSFCSPISVNAVVGRAPASDDEEGREEKARRPCVVVGADTQWMTGRIAVEPADAFRIDMSVKQSSSFVGAPLVVSLRVLNLSKDVRDLMLLMAKDDDKDTSQRSGAVNTAVVSEVNGYTFGVWGLAGEDDGTIRHNRDHELLAVDAALLLGEVKGQHSVDAELRFVPLREGTLNVPNFKLYDKFEGKWYNCLHKLKIVAAAKDE